MNCGEWEKRAALHAGADLAAVEQCAGCGAHARMDFVERYFRRRV
jgi:hypothetical protein